MKRFIILLVTVVAFNIFTYAEGENDNKSPNEATPIKWEFRKKGNVGDIPHRKPIHINIEAYYNDTTNSIEITYYGEAEGEVYLYKGNNLIDYSSSINTTFTLPSPSGTYTIEIISDSWEAQGQIQL